VLDTQNNFDEIFSNLIITKNSNIDITTIKNIIEQSKIALFNNKDLIIHASTIDKKNNNGFLMDFNIIENIFKLIEQENKIYGTVILSEKDDKKKIIYGKQIMNIGNIIIINDGNPYTIIEMILRNILANNKVLFNNNGYMNGTNNLIIQIFQNILEKYNLSKDIIQLYIYEDIEKILKNFANIDLVICIGNHMLQQEVLNKSKNKTIISGYNYFDIYIEDKTNLEFINKIINSNINLNIYINKEINIDYENIIIVDDIDEAIAQINYNGNKYSCAIFTNSKDNASKFIREINSSIITVNTSPTIETICDIKQSDLILEKTIIYPNSLNIKNRN